MILFKDEVSHSSSSFMPSNDGIQPGVANSREAAKNLGKEYVHSVIFASNVTALAAKLAKCDGPLAIAELENFQVCFALPAINLDYQKLFAAALEDNIGAEHYAARLDTFFGDQPDVAAGIMRGLFKYAACDAPVNFQEIVTLKKISLALGFNNESFKEILKGHMVPKGADAFEILAVNRRISEIDLKKVYREAVQLYHPDLIGFSMPIPEVVSIANERIATINAAYKKIVEARNF